MNTYVAIHEDGAIRSCTSDLDKEKALAAMPSNPWHGRIVKLVDIGEVMSFWTALRCPPAVLSTELSWTNELPKAPGYYWMMAGPHPFIVSVTSKRKVFLFGANEPLPLDSTDTLWCGPLQPPTVKPDC